MEQHIIEIVRFAVCNMAILVAIVLMIKADDNNIMRRLAVAFAALLVYFNEQIGVMTYLLIGSTLETLIAAMGGDIRDYHSCCNYDSAGCCLVQMGCWYSLKEEKHVLSYFQNT